jgi:hypothetical protein
MEASRQFGRREFQIVDRKGVTAASVASYRAGHQSEYHALGGGKLAGGDPDRTRKSLPGGELCSDRDSRTGLQTKHVEAPRPCC